MPSLRTGQGGEGQENSDSDPSMEEPSMVPSPPPHEHQQSLSSSPVEGSVNEPSGRSTSPHGLGRTHSDCLAGSGNPWRVEVYQTPTVLQYQLLTPHSRIIQWDTSYCLQTAG